VTRRLGNLLAGSADVIVIGAGHSGLAMSRFLSASSIDHVVFERGEVANSWINERWDSLRLLTPNWLSSLPGYRYTGPRPDEFMSMTEIVDFIQGYARFSRAPVMTATEVTSVRQVEGGYRVETSRGAWRARAVVVASGAFNVAAVPRISEAIPKKIAQFTAQNYRNAEQLPNGGVLVVGASASGLQLASEIRASGRPVTLAVGEHVRMPRVYRGKDIQYWMDVVGFFDERYDAVDDIRRARRVPSPQLIGCSDRRTLDLNALATEGVRLTGRIAGVRDGKAQFSGSLRNVCKLGDLKMNRMLDAIDLWITEFGAKENANPVERFAPTVVDDSPCLCIDLADGGIQSLVWATGFRPDYSWLDVPVLDRKGQIRHDGGVADAPGLYVLGLPYLRRRKSSFIHGAEDDARDLNAHLLAHLDKVAPRKVSGLAV
jgi:putative flavoprotein involved in K+ transport